MHFAYFAMILFRRAFSSPLSFRVFHAIAFNFHYAAADAYTMMPPDAIADFRRRRCWRYTARYRRQPPALITLTI